MWFAGMKNYINAKLNDIYFSKYCDAFSISCNFYNCDLHIIMGDFINIFSLVVP